MKTVSLASGNISVPENLLAAQDVLGMVAQPKTRWNVGSLVAAILASHEAACVLAICPGYVHAGVAHETQLLILSAVAGSTSISEFVPAVGNTRSREITCTQKTYTVSDSGLLGGFQDELVDSIARPQVPSYTVSGLVNEIFAYFEALSESQDQEIDFVVIVNQFDGKVHVIQGIDLLGTPTASEVFVSSAFAAGSVSGITGEVVFSAILSDEVEVIDNPVVLPVWG